MGHGQLKLNCIFCWVFITQLSLLHFESCIWHTLKKTKLKLTKTELRLSIIKMSKTTLKTKTNWIRENNLNKIKLNFNVKSKSIITLIGTPSLHAHSSKNRIPVRQKVKTEVQYFLCSVFKTPCLAVTVCAWFMSSNLISK